MAALSSEKSILNVLITYLKLHYKCFYNILNSSDLRFYLLD